MTIPSTAKDTDTGGKTLLMKMQNGTATVENGLIVSYKFNLTFNSVIPLLGIDLNVIKTMFTQKLLSKCLE